MKYFLLLLVSTAATGSLCLFGAQERTVVTVAYPQFPGVGTHTRTASADPLAQKYFDQGLAFLYAFNHDEAIRSFEQAAKLDTACALAEWGTAIANGPHINKPVLPADRAQSAWLALQRAKRFADKATPVTQALIAALEHRYSEDPKADRAIHDQAYADAMKKVWQRFPDDADVGALYAESLMDLRPWDLWTQAGEPQPGTPELLEVLDKVLALNPNHPLGCHLYIHAVEASREPHRADAAAFRLRNLQPGLGHMVHMPTHIDVRCGRWQQAIDSNALAIEADDAYRKTAPNQDFYRLYMAHNHHMLAFAAMMSGQSKRAHESVKTMLAGVPAEWVAVPENAAIADGFLAAPYEVMMRFGEWDEILKQPKPPAVFPIANALLVHARGVAFAAKGQTEEARAELAAFRAAAEKTPKEAAFGQNKASDLYAVADSMLEGEILARENKLDDAIASLRKAAAKEDTLRYDEPPDWIVPIRHALGAFLLKAGRAVEAETAYREDLKKWPNNGWSLHGLAESLEAQGKTGESEIVRERFRAVWKNADAPIKASCLCAVGG